MIRLKGKGLLAKLFFLSVIFFLALPHALWGQKGKKVKYKAELSEYQKLKDGREQIKLNQSVVFEHQGALMHCDSAYFFPKENSIEAFSNIHVNQGDTVHLYGDQMDYNGNTKVLIIRGNVRLIDQKMTLTCDEITYDRNTGRANYFGGGNISDLENQLYSKIGVYNSQSKWFLFKDSVRLRSAKYHMVSDTLLYHPESGVTRFRGPSTIESDSGFIYCSYGDYDTKNGIAYFSNRAEIHDRSQILIGDSIYYNKATTEGVLVGNVYVEDTIQKFIIRGQYAKYRGKPEYAFVTGQPIYTMLTDGDSVHVHGDTLRIITEGNHKKVRVSPNAVIYKTDLQGKCDSLTYSESDSTMRMYVQPVLWSNESQLTAEHIYLTLRNEKLDSIYMIKKAFILTKVDSIKYDQVRGKNMYGKFANNELYSLRVIGNGQTVYTVEDKGVQQGINRADCSDMIVRFKDSKIFQVVFINKPNAKLYPLRRIPSGELYLRGFNPRFEEKPKHKSDLLKK